MIMHKSPSRCNRKLSYFFDLRSAPIHPKLRIIFYDRSYYFPCGKTDSMLCSKTIT
jgi:hypothetical protein